jgi:deferrochelatase/peroxidase EfeB
MTSDGKKLSRRRLLAIAGAGLGASAGGAALLRAGEAGSDAAQAAPAETVVPFHGSHQAGILTPAQRHVRFASYDLQVSSAGELRSLMQDWTAAAELMTAGRPLGPLSSNQLQPPVDTGEAEELSAERLTLTFGFGPGLFEKVGLRSLMPEQLAPLPHFAFDDLDPATTGGDICVQACADDAQVAFHAVRNLTRIGFGRAAARYVQTGFLGLPGGGATPRNLMGFRDGTANPKSSDAAMMTSNVWADAADGQAWMHGGSYLVSRRIRIQLEAWDRTPIGEQETIFGRHRTSGAPIGGTAEHDTVDPARLPPHAHIRLANPRTPETESQRILRRGYNFDDGMVPGLTQTDAGLFFLAYQRDPRKQFVPIQTRLAAADRLNEYILHTGSGLWAVPPGIDRGGYVGESLLDA